MRITNSLSRREFIKISLLGITSLAFREYELPEFPQADRLGRVNVGMTELKARPDSDSDTLGQVYGDTIVPWLREVVGRRPWRKNQRWVETPDGYIWAPYLQPVKNLPNSILSELPESTLGPGMWAEVSVPYLDVVLGNPPARSPWLQNTETPRVYYTQVFWIDQIKTDKQGQIWYRINERFGFGDVLWARAEGFRPLKEADVAPIAPNSEEKRVVVDVARQTLSCFEGKNEVYFTQVSTGMMNDFYGNLTDKWETPEGIRPIWRKLISVHMTGGTTGGGYDIAGVSWTTLFEGNGVAIHSTFWHNNFGEAMSQGCVNCRPEDAQWIFRWTLPVVPYDPGDVTLGMPGGTLVEVVK
ncbi:MAG: L,D-transpeptidase [Bellilinea sp.]